MREQVRQHAGVSNPRSDLIQIQGIDYDERELSTSMSVISFDESDLSGNILNDLDHIYTQRFHQRCMMLTYLTLLSMTCAALSWMIYWLLYNQFVLIFQILIFSFLGISPCLFILMIISWLIFSCRNPFDRIRTNFICFRLEGIHWQNQLNYYFKQKSCWNYFPQKKLIDRNFGYIILSPHGIVFDELFLKISCKPIIVNGIFVEHDRILKFECKKIPTKEFLVYLPEELIKPETFEELTRILKIPMNGARF
ncbi:hypothetical protein I4U23_026860 [Adineta vaga]|nr:hypothetical protein I4U23_026860 [Adineta vaga]